MMSREFHVVVENFPPNYNFKAFLRDIKLRDTLFSYDQEAIVCKFNYADERNYFARKIKARIVGGSVLAVRSYDVGMPLTPDMSPPQILKPLEYRPMKAHTSFVETSNRFDDLSLMKKYSSPDTQPLYRESLAKIIYLYDPITFACQLESDIIKINYIEKQLRGKFEAFANEGYSQNPLTENEYYICNFAKNYYRGLCLAINREKCKMFLIDYGYTQDFPHKKVCPLPDTFISPSRCRVLKFDKVTLIQNKKKEAHDFMKQYLNSLIGFQFRRFEDGIFYIIGIDGIYNIHVKMVKLGLLNYMITANG